MLEETLVSAAQPFHVLSDPMLMLVQPLYEARMGCVIVRTPVQRL